MSDSFRKIIEDFAKSMEIADSRRPVWQSLSGQKTIFKPVIGPHPETKNHRISHSGINSIRY